MNEGIKQGSFLGEKKAVFDSLWNWDGIAVFNAVFNTKTNAEFLLVLNRSNNFLTFVQGK